MVGMREGKDGRGRRENGTNEFERGYGRAARSHLMGGGTDVGLVSSDESRSAQEMRLDWDSPLEGT